MILWIKSGGRLSPMTPFLVSFFSFLFNVFGYLLIFDLDILNFFSMDKYIISEYPSLLIFRDFFTRVVEILRGLNLYKAFSFVRELIVVFRSISFLLAK